MANFDKQFKQIKLCCPFTVIKNSFSVAIKNNNGEWIAEQFYNCREVFHDDFNRFDNLVISTPNYKLIRLYKMLKLIEVKLNLSKKSKIYTTQRKNVFFIKLSKFWVTNIKYTLLTFLVRSSLKIKNLKNTEELIKHNKYLRDTRYAVERFFSGNVKYRGKEYSWYKAFNKLSKEDCDKFLVKRIYKLY